LDIGHAIEFLEHGCQQRYGPFWACISRSSRYD